MFCGRKLYESQAGEAGCVHKHIHLSYIHTCTQQRGTHTKHNTDTKNTYVHLTYIQTQHVPTKHTCRYYTHTDTHMCIDTHKTHSTHTVYTHRDIQIHAPYIQTHVHIIHTDIHTCCVLELGVCTIHPEIVS